AATTAKSECGAPVAAARALPRVASAPLIDRRAAALTLDKRPLRASLRANVPPHDVVPAQDPEPCPRGGPRVGIRVRTGERDRRNRRGKVHYHRRAQPDH